MTNVNIPQFIIVQILVTFIQLINQLLKTEQQIVRFLLNFNDFLMFVEHLIILIAFIRV